MIYGSVCSGIEAATVAWHPLGWKPSFFSEIEAFPRSVLQHHYPDTPLHGDFTTIEKGQYEEIDLLVGGTPCQSFSVAGLRKGMDDERGNLALEFVRLAQRLRPRWIVWENVPGVLSSNKGRDFGSLIGALDELGYGLAWRVLDAKNFGVPQRRRRVFLVGYFGDWRPAAAVLFEPQGVCGSPTESRKARKTTSRGIEVGAFGGRFTELNPTLDARAKDGMIRNQTAGGYSLCLNTVANTLTAKANDRWEPTQDNYVIACSDNAGTLFGSGAGMERCSGTASETDFLVGVAPTLTAYNTDSRSPQSEEQQRIVKPIFDSVGQVRRLTPIECERLQGFPDNYTLVSHRGKPAADGPRYKAIGNSMAVPVMRWIGERIDFVDKLLKQQESEDAA